jgi:MYXO-CTERM domain-containing protein
MLPERARFSSLFCAVVLAAATPSVCNAQEDNDGDGHTVEAGDCDDCDPAVFPGATELCNGIDDDCDGLVDEDFDDDGDGTGDCYDDDGDGASELGGDCDDTDPLVGPGVAEDCNGIDDDCDGLIDEDFDDDGDGTGDCYDDDGDGLTEMDGDCDDTDAGISPAIPESCNARDDDCDGQVDEDFDSGTSAGSDGTSDCIDDDGDGRTEQAGDCNDQDPSINLGSTEQCEDGLDNDCDGNVDFRDYDCMVQAEQASGMICECDFPDPPPQTRRTAGRAGVALAGLSLLLVIRRRP